MIIRKIVMTLFVVILLWAYCLSGAVCFQSDSSAPIISRPEIAYSEEVISEAYQLVFEEPAATFNASYPIFDDPRYSDLNRIIMENEVSRWEEIFVEICEQADDDITADPSLAAM